MPSAPPLPAAPPLLSAPALALPVESPPFRQFDVLSEALEAGVGWSAFVVDWQLDAAEPETR
jgi:hypothetical protein